MKIATWNVNSIKARLSHVLDWLTTNQPDVLCLQETKVEDINFPLAEIHAVGYQAQYHGQKAYNGVAILSKWPATEVSTGIPEFEDSQSRVISASVKDLRVICMYGPNGQSVGSDKYNYKLRWYAALTKWLEGELKRYPKLVILGDYNVAPEDRDVHDPQAWLGNVLVSPAEREAFQALLNLGFKDSFRLFEQDDVGFTWWDYRMGAFRRNMGLRIDHILLSAELAKFCKNCIVDKVPRKLERPSDHTPVSIELCEDVSEYA